MVFAVVLTATSARTAPAGRHGVRGDGRTRPEHETTAAVVDTTGTAVSSARASVGRLNLAVGRGCLDLVRDCGAKGDGQADDTAAFAVCQSKIKATRRSRGGLLAHPDHLDRDAVQVAAVPGCVVVPARHYRCIGVALATSHVAWLVAAGTVFSPPPVSQIAESRQGSLFLVGAQNRTDTTAVRNITVAGIDAGGRGRFTVDVSKPLTGPLAGKRQGGFMFRGAITGFGLHNLNVLLPGATNTGIANALEFNNIAGSRKYLSPSHGTVTNITTTGGQWGYGTAQIQSGNYIHFENLDGEGGVTLRLETGIGGGYVGGITATNITCRNGHAAVMTEPHCQVNGQFLVDGVLSLGCSVAVETNGGYRDNTRHPGLPPGTFSNTSRVTNVVGVFGEHAQAAEGVNEWPACSVWGNENSVLNYRVQVKISTLFWGPFFTRSQSYAPLTRCVTHST